MDLKNTLDLNNTLIGVLGIKVVEQGKDKFVATMPVHDATRQPFGILHGGASVALAETVASMGTYCFIDSEKEYAVGLEINANHISSKRDGIVTATGVPIHVGKTTAVWEIKITDEEGKLICISRCTMAIRKRKDV